MSLSDLINAAREIFQDVLDENDFLSDPHQTITGIVDPMVPTNRSSLADLLREEPEIAFAEPELAHPGDSPAKVIELAVYERLCQELWEMYHEARERGPERWRIRHEGAGGFLNPPGHPEHGLSLNTEGGWTSLSYVVEHPDEFPAAAVRACQAELDRWEPGEPDADWVHTVLGYFKGAYLSSGGSRNVSDHIYPTNMRAVTIEEFDGLVVDNELGVDWGPPWHVDPMKNIDRHAGVAYIRRYYPDFVPTEEDFAKAYWGSKPDAE